MTETFDTLGATRQLHTAGMERPHAEAVADVVRSSRNGLATQDGMDALCSEIKTGMDALRRELATHRWVLGLIAAMVMAILVVMLTRAF